MAVDLHRASDGIVDIPVGSSGTEGRQQADFLVRFGNRMQDQFPMASGHYHDQVGLVTQLPGEEGGARQQWLHLSLPEGLEGFRTRRKTVAGRYTCRRNHPLFLRPESMDHQGFRHG